LVECLAVDVDPFRLLIPFISSMIQTERDGQVPEDRKNEHAFSDLCFLSNLPWFPIRRYL